METKNLIQSAANVLKVTRVSVGDVVKMVEDGSYSVDIYYGVILDMLNNGEKSFIQIMRYKKSYSAIDCDIKTYSGDKDMNLFPATVYEVKEHFDSCLKNIAEDLSKKEKELLEKKEAYKKAVDFVSNETSKKLTEASFKEVTQVEYNEMKTNSVF